MHILFFYVGNFPGSYGLRDHQSPLNRKVKGAFAIHRNGKILSDWVTPILIRSFKSLCNKRNLSIKPKSLKLLAYNKQSSIGYLQESIPIGFCSQIIHCTKIIFRFGVEALFFQIVEYWSKLLIIIFARFTHHSNYLSVTQTMSTGCKFTERKWVEAVKSIESLFKRKIRSPNQFWLNILIGQWWH